MTTWSQRFFPSRNTPPPADRASTEFRGSGRALDAALDFVGAVYGSSVVPLETGLAERRRAAETVPVDVAEDRLGASERDAHGRACLALIDHLPFAVVLVDAGARVLLANAAAIESMRARRLVTAADGLLCAVDALVTDWLRAAVSRMCSTPGPTDPMLTVVPLARDNAWPHLIVIGLDGAFGQACAAVVFPDRERVSGAAQLVASLYSLTPAQSRIAMLILEGRTLAEAARILDVRDRTALETWKAVRSKLRTRNDSECLQLLRAALMTCGPGGGTNDRH